MEHQTKRGPGRPPRKTHSVISALGILQNPHDPKNMIEMVYHDASIFKYIFTTLKNLKVVEVYFYFRPQACTIYSQDHISNPIVIDINCSNLNSYYCAKPVYILMTENNLQKIFVSPRNSVDKILIEYENMVDESCDDRVSVTMTDFELGREKTYFIPAILDNNPPEWITQMPTNIDTSISRLSFKLSVKYFKETISDALAYGGKISIEKHGTDCMEIKFEKISTDVCIERYKNGSNIDLISNIADDESFRCSLHTITIKSITSGLLNNMIRINCMDNNVAIFSINLSDIVILNIRANAT